MIMATTRKKSNLKKKLEEIFWLEPLQSSSEVLGSFKLPEVALLKPLVMKLL